MVTGRRNLGLLLVFSMLWFSLSSGSAYACGDTAERTEPWPANSQALLRGKVISVSNDGRKAILTISAYVGPLAPAPATVALPATRNNVPRGTKCVDPSIRFLAGGEYIVFLSALPPDLRLADPSGVTAYRVLLDGRSGDLQQLGDSLVRDFAAKHQYVVSTPSAGQAVHWEAPRRFPWGWSLGTLVGCSGIAWLLWNKRRRT